MITCDNCGTEIHLGMQIETPQGIFCDEDCKNSFNQPKPQPFDGWDEPADCVSRKYNHIFSSWERTAKDKA